MPTFSPSYLLALYLLTFLFIKYLPHFLSIDGFPYPLFSFLFPISGLNDFVFGTWNLNFWLKASYLPEFAFNK
jgi:hypothetical protein